MGLRLLPLILLAMLGLLHAQLWLGRGSIPNVASLQQKIDEQQARNAAAQRINDQLASEVNDLKEGWPWSKNVPASSWAWSGPTRSSSRSPNKRPA